MFAAETIESFRDRFRELPAERFDSILAWVEQLEARSPLDNPNAMLHSLLTRALTEHNANPTAATDTAKAGAGSLRPDGSWDRGLVFASATERLVRALAHDCAEKLLAPAQAAEIADASPELNAALGHRADWPRLTGAALTAPGHHHDRAAWVEAAWRAAHTSTSAAEVLKRRILAMLSPKWQEV